MFNRSLAEKLKKLQEALDDRKLSFNALSAKNAKIRGYKTRLNKANNRWVLVLR